MLQQRLQMFNNPIYIVLDAQRRVVMLSDSEGASKSLRGARLAKTLRQLLRSLD